MKIAYSVKLNTIKYTLNTKKIYKYIKTVIKIPNTYNLPISYLKSLGLDKLFILFFKYVFNAWRRKGFLSQILTF